MVIETVSISELLPDKRNARKHGARNLAAIKGSLAKFGQVEPVVVQRSTGKVIGGHGRLEAMKALGWPKVDIVRVDVDDTKAKALGLALNRTGELAEWDNDILASLLHELRADDFDLLDIGFDVSSLDHIYDEGEGEELAPSHHYEASPGAASPSASPAKVTGAKELSADEFDNFAHSCPRCGFEFNG